MLDSQTIQGDRGRVLKLILLAAVLLVTAEGVLNLIVTRYLAAILVNYQGGFPPDFGIYQLVESVYFLLSYYALAFIVFYFIGSKPGLQIGRDYFAVLKYSFVGGVIGGAIELPTAAFITSIQYGLSISLNSFGITSIASFFSVLVGFIRNGIAVALLAFAAIAIRNYRRNLTSEVVKPTGQSETQA